MPEAERNEDIPSQEYGERVEREEFLEMTAPGPPPAFFTPQPAQPTQPQAQPTGNQLAPDMFAALARPAAMNEGDFTDEDDIPAWTEFFESIAAQPGASRAIRTIAQRLRARM